MSAARAGDRSTATTEPRISTDKVRGVVDTLARSAAGVEIGAALSGAIQRLSEQAQQPGRLEQPSFQRALAYAVQDFEKVAGPLALPHDARSDLSRLAVAMPGLQNERLQHLLQATPTIADQGLSNDIRRMAKEVSRLPQQDTPEIASRVDVLEGKVRLAGRVHAAETVAPESRGVSAGTSATKTSRPAPEGESGREREKNSAAQEQPSSQILINSPGANALLSVMTAAFGRRAERPPAPWDGPRASLSDRHDQFEASTMGRRREDQALQSAERSGQAAMEALQSFNNGPGATMLVKIQDAAKANPGGLQAVLAEMREGGRFGDLRQEFNAALVSEKGFKAAYDRAASALAQYGEDRAGVDQILGRRAASDRMQATFQRLDSEISQAASLLPGRGDGKSAMDELADKAKAALSKAFDAVRSMFSAGASTQAATRPSAGPSMSM